VLWHIGWAAGTAKMGGRWRWALLSPDGVAPSRMVVVSSSVNLPLHHKVQKFSSGTSSPAWSWKRAIKHVCVTSNWITWSDGVKEKNKKLRSIPRDAQVHNMLVCLCWVHVCCLHIITDDDGYQYSYEVNTLFTCMKLYRMTTAVSRQVSLWSANTCILILSLDKYKS